ncbi:insertion element IS476 uncharacterized 39.2 kDa protein-like [Stegodyphus dumicola]|uniref:insertion element IS476 uncharacterized 39.2 kDa protein-like n=1 Tax=Stegodyphus dumicola TaxID=202533 RepID=UPI0015ADB8E0|nr:insertion element IS476 uncharacterized 39.2 kDa protein-like [Stegodyphus dumicola]
MEFEIIRGIHNKGHFAVQKTEDLLKRDFHISNATKKIEHVIMNCVECILCNKKRGKAEGLLNPIPKDNIPLSTYHIDFVGPLTSTDKRYRHIFTVVDAFTKFVWFYPVKTTSTAEAVQKLKIQQAVFGNPSRIISDKGSAFTSKDFEEYCKDEGIQHIQITTGVPLANSQIEKIHGTLIPVLAKL